LPKERRTGFDPLMVLQTALRQPPPSYQLGVRVRIADKKLQWIEGTTARWDGYLEFQRRPGPMLEWFDQHMA
jgi:hypothetical protein